MPPDQFEPLVADALDALPDWIMPIVAEIAVIVEVLGHEAGHALGLPEARLRELGWH